VQGDVSTRDTLKKQKTVEGIEREKEKETSKGGGYDGSVVKTADRKGRKKRSARKREKNEQLEASSSEGTNDEREGVKESNKKKGKRRAERVLHDAQGKKRDS